MSAGDPRATISEALRQTRAAISALREGVVQAVMRRNKLADDVARVERLVADLETKATLAEQIKQERLAKELRDERATREKELAQLRTLLAKAEVEADTAKTTLPEAEARLMRQLNDLQAAAVEGAGAQIAANAPGGLSEADDLWARAGGKIGDMRREASARDEVTAARLGVPTGALYTPQTGPSQQSAEELLTALEQRLGLTSESSVAPAPPTTYLELEDTLAPLAATPTAETSVSAMTPEPETGETPRDSFVAPLPSIPTRATYRNISAVIKGDPSRMEPTARVRVAGVGTGGIFQGAHLPCYADIPQAQLVAICDPDKTAQDRTYKRYQTLMEARIKKAQEANDLASAEQMERDLETIQICDDISEVIETVKPDLVDIATQPDLHTPLSIQALEAGIHVMCEKPLSRSWLESRRLIETIERTGKFYQHNENWLFEPDYYTVRKLVDAGAIGEVAMMFVTQAHGGPEGNPKFWNPNFGGGGALLDNGIHAIGAAWFISGLEKSPTYVKASEPFGMSIRMPQRIIDGRMQQITVDDDAHILVRFEDSVTHTWTTAHVEGSWSHQDSPETMYIGSTGRIVMRNEENRRYAVIIDAYGNETRKLQVSGMTWSHWPSGHYGEILNMIQCVRANQKPIMTAEWGADQSAIVGAAYLSEKKGKQPVHVDEFKQFARDIAARYPNDPKGADNALVDALLAAVREK